MRALLGATVAAAMSLTGCGVLDGSDHDRWRPIEGQIRMSVIETHPSPSHRGVPVPGLYLETLDEYECDNYRIVAQSVIRNGVIEIVVTGCRLQGSICLTSFGPATLTIPVPSSLHRCTMLVRHGGRTDRYDLTIDDTLMRLVPVDIGGTVPGDTLRWRYPARSMAYWCSARGTDTSLCHDFLDTLHRYLALETVSAPTQGIWPYESFTAVFQYRRERDFLKAGELLDVFSHDVLSQHPNVAILIVNWRNERYDSRSLWP